MIASELKSDRYRWPRFNREQVFANLHEEDIIERYTVMHDCGKPFCRVEVDGKVHLIASRKPLRRSR